jgi:hypothetical protein
MDNVICETCLKPIGLIPFYAVHIQCCVESDGDANLSSRFGVRPGCGSRRL